MFSPLTSWLRPAPARRRPAPARPAALGGVVPLEDRVVPDTTPFALAGGQYFENWGASPLAVLPPWSVVPNAEGYGGGGLAVGTPGDPRTIAGGGTGTDTPAGSPTITITPANQVPNATVAGTVAYFTGTGVGNDNVVALRPAPGSSPFLVFNVNTQGVADVFVGFRLRGIDGTNAAIAPVALQYRVGNTGPFLNAPAVTYTPNVPTGGTVTVGGVSAVSGRLPPGASGQNLVQVRLITTETTGDRWVGVDDILIEGNKAPVLTLTAGTLALNEPTGRGTLLSNQIDAGLTLTDDQAILRDTQTPVNGTLTVTLSSSAPLGAAGPDTLQISSGGGVTLTTVGAVTTVRVGGAPVGDVTGLGTGSITVTLNAASATPANVQIVARQVTFNNSSDVPDPNGVTPAPVPAVTRTATFTVTDGRGGSITAARNISITERNDPPYFPTFLGTAPSTPEEVVKPLTGITVNDVDIRTGTLKLTIALGNPAAGVLRYTAAAGESVAGNDTATVVVTGTVAQINASLGTAAPGGLQFRPALNFNTDPPDAAVPLTFTLDDQGSTGPLPEGTPPFQQVTSITVTPVNDPPVVNLDPLAAGPVSYPLNSPPVLVAPDATVTDPDYPKSADFNGGILTVDFSAGSLPSNSLAVRNQGFADGQIGLLGQAPNTNVTYSFTTAGPTGPVITTVVVGQITNYGLGTAPLQITLGANATPAIVEKLVRNITFQTLGTAFDPTVRTLRLVLTDGDGFSQTIAATVPSATPYNTATRNIVPVTINTAPSFTLPATVVPAVAEDAPAQTVPGFATNISKGQASYESGQLLDFKVASNTNPGLFLVAPDIDPATGNLTYTLAPNANGTATVGIYLMDDGGTLNGGADTSPTQTITFTVTPVADTPSVSATSTTEDVQTSTGLVVTRNPADGAETPFFQVTAIRNGTLYLNDGVTPVHNGDFVTFAQGGLGLKFTPAAEQSDATLGANAFGFSVQAATSNSPAGLGGGVVTVDIPVAQVNDNPTIAGVNGTTTSYLNGQAPTLVAGAAVVGDVDSPDFDTGTLTVTISSGGQAGDVLAINDLGIGTITGGTGGAPLQIALTPAATPTTVQAALRTLTFFTPAALGAAGTRVVTVVLTDGDGGVTTPSPTTSVNVTDQVSAVSLVATGTSPTAATAGVTWRLTTDLPITGFAASNFSFAGSLAAGSAVTNIVAVGGTNTVYDVTASVGGTGNGTLALVLADETGLSVGLTNEPFTGDLYAVDRTGPIVTAFGETPDDPDNLVPVNRPITFTVTFDEPVFNVQAADFVNGGTAPTNPVQLVSVVGNVVTLSVTPTGAGTVVLRLPAPASPGVAITDGLGNPATGPYTAADVLTVDAVPPTVATFANNTNSSPANVTAPNTAVTYTVTFSEAVDPATVTLAAFGTAGSVPVTITSLVMVSPTVYTVQYKAAAVGTIRPTVGGAITDVAGNPITAATDPASVQVNVNPVAAADFYTIGEDGVLTTTATSGVRFNDTDSPGDVLTVDAVPVIAPAKGSVALNPDGSFTYTPNPNANGADTFTYRVRDQFGGTATAVASVNITAVNDAPTFALPLTPPGTPVQVYEDSGSAQITGFATNITAGPAEEANQALAGFALTVSDPTAFSTQPTISLSGRLNFTPAPNYFGTVTVTATLTDIGAGSPAPNVNFLTRTFQIQVLPVNDAPSFSFSGTGNPPVSAEDGGRQTVGGFAVFNPGPGEGGQKATYTSTFSTTGGLAFTAPPAIAPDGTLTYTAAPNTNGTATVVVRVQDDGGTANGGVDTSVGTRSFVIVVRSVDDLPVAHDDAAVVAKNSPGTIIDVLSNDAPDAGGSQVLAVDAIATPATNGVATVRPGGRGVIYTPNPGFTGTDTFTYVVRDGSGGPATATVTVTVIPAAAGQPLFDVVAVGAGPGGSPLVRVNSLSTSAFTGTFFAYSPTFRGGVNVGVGDVNGDGVPDVITTAGFGGGPHVKVVDGSKLGLVNPDGSIADAAVLASFYAYDPKFTGGVVVTVADVDGDGKSDIITGTGPGGGAHVKVISGAMLGLPTLGDGQVNPAAVLASFLAYDDPFRGGVSVAAADVNGDGVVDIVTAAGQGGGSHVKAFSGLGGPLLRSFYAYDKSFTGGVSVAAGDLDGDGLADIITGAGVGGGPHVKVFGTSDTPIASFMGLTGSAKGADVAFRVTKNGTPLVVVGSQTGGTQVRTYAVPGFTPYNGFDAFEPTFLGGVEVG